MKYIRLIGIETEMDNLRTDEVNLRVFFKEM